MRRNSNKGLSDRMWSQDILIPLHYFVRTPPPLMRTHTHTHTHTPDAPAIESRNYLIQLCDTADQSQPVALRLLHVEQVTCASEEPVTPTVPDMMKQ